MKSLIYAIGISLLMSLGVMAANPGTQSTPVDSVKMMYSLFSEFHKNHDYESALPYGWWVLERDPEQFKKYIFYKMDDILTFKHDSTDITQEEKCVVADTAIYLYDLAMNTFTDDALYFQQRKTRVYDSWKQDVETDTMIAQYEAIVNMDSTVHSYYWDRLGQFYKVKSVDDPEFKAKALEVFTFLNEREPDEPKWESELQGLVENIDELIDLTKKAWDRNQDDLAKGEKYASLLVKAERYDEAITALKTLIEKDDSNLKYWNQIAAIYLKQENWAEAQTVFEKLTELEPESKEHHLNLGITLKNQNKFSAARKEFNTASDLADGWGLAIYYVASLYEATASSCGDSFMRGLVYMYARSTYSRAYSIDPELEEARQRAGALSGAGPTKEQFFFKGYSSGQSIPLSGCGAWIGGSITVP